MNRKGFTLIELMIVVIIIGILAAIAIPNFISMQQRAKEAKVKGMAHTLQLAAEDWAVREDGIYTVLAEIQALLPGEKLLENAFTGENTEPQFGSEAAMPGQVGIQALSLDREVLITVPAGKDDVGNDIFTYVDSQGMERICSGYKITGFGASKHSGVNGIIIDLTSGQ